MSQRLFCKKKKGVSKKNILELVSLEKDWSSKELSKKTGATQWCDWLAQWKNGSLLMFLTQLHKRIELSM
jgi:hypothetical protein